MPPFQLFTNVAAVDIPKTFHAEMSEVIMQLLGVKQQWLLMHVVADQCMTFGGSREPTAVCHLQCIGKISAEENQIYSQTICEKLHTTLGISPDRVYIFFHKMNGSNCGWNYKTFAYKNKPTPDPSSQNVL